MPTASSHAAGSEIGLPGDALSPAAFEWLVWQLADSAFPSGGFAHSGGLEASWHHGEVRNRLQCHEWLKSSLSNVANAVLPFVLAAHVSPGDYDAIDRYCEAFTSNHVANRASRLQGRSFLMAARKTFPSLLPECGVMFRHHHLAPTFGLVTRTLQLPAAQSLRLFLFIHLRGQVGSAVRLNLLGPMEGQGMQRELHSFAEEMVQHALQLDLEDAAQTTPLCDIWHGSHDRLASRLFQS